MMKEWKSRVSSTAFPSADATRSRLAETADFRIRMVVTQAGSTGQEDLERQRGSLWICVNLTKQRGLA